MSIITLLTDFGADSPYVAAMKGVILSINPAVTLVDLTHSIRPQDVREGALVLEDVAEYFPPATIHVAVVDPGVGTDRAIVFAQIGSQCYLAPDNGLLDRLSRNRPPSQIVRLTNPACYWRSPLSATFHGRDILAPAAAHLSSGLDPAELGVAAETLVGLDWPPVRQSPRRIEGAILRIDAFGNLMTNITAEMFAALPPVVPYRIVCCRALIERAESYGYVPPGTPLALIGSNGRLEIAITGGSAAARLHAQVGDEVVIEWKEEPSA